jgi:RIO-like serine/threonine protein kinase
LPTPTTLQRDPADGRRAPFSRADLEHGPVRPLHQGRWANAVVGTFESGGHRWVVKDFRPRSFLVRNLIGRLLIRRESRGLGRLAGVQGAPEGAFRIDAFALAYRFVPGTGLRRYGGELTPEFFPALERTVLEMHARGRIVHLDMRNADNILVTESGAPMLLDFQSHLALWWMPGPLRRLVQRIDCAAIYKHWARRSPETMGPERRALLDRINALRPLWAVRGYMGSSRDAGGTS